MMDHQRDSEASNEMQGLKTRNKQAEFNREVENEDAYYKFLAYSGMLQKNRGGANYEKTMNDPMIYAGFEGFDNTY